MPRPTYRHSKRHSALGAWSFCFLLFASMAVLTDRPKFTSAADGTSGQTAADAGGSWVTLAAAPTRRTEVVAAATQGKIFVMGGFLAPTLSSLTTLAVTDLVEEYDPPTNSWSAKAPLPNGLHHAGAAVVGGKVYVIGGYARSFLNIWHPVATVYMYDSDKNVWTERTPMPTPRGALALVECKGKLYAIGGYDRTKNIGALEVYDPTSDSWSTRSPLPTPRDHLAAAVVHDRIYAIGGRLNGSYSNNLAVTEAYDPDADRWTRVADMPTARSGITAGVLRNVIYVVGGEAPEGTFRTNEAYRPDIDRWQPAPPMPTSRHGLGSAVVNERYYVISGGPTPGGSFSDVNEAFSAGTKTSSDPGNRMARSRAPTKHVGTVMALLAAFEDAGALPPESSPDAMRLIKGLIQFQAAFMRSSDPAVQEFLGAAMAEQLAERGPAAVDTFRAEGWSSTSLEALVKYASLHSPWGRTEVIEGFRPYNVGPTEFEVISRTYQRAQNNLASRGQDLHTVYAARRREMPGAGM